jgi:hypothetical protein
VGANARTSASPASQGWISQYDTELAHTARDELRVLRTEVEDQDPVGVDVARVAGSVT